MSNLLESYLAEARKIPLLGRDDEIQLGQEMEQGEELLLHELAHVDIFRLAMLGTVEDVLGGTRRIDEVFAGLSTQRQERTRVRSRQVADAAHELRRMHRSIVSGSNGREYGRPETRQASLAEAFAILVGRLQFRTRILTAIAAEVFAVYDSGRPTCPTTVGRRGDPAGCSCFACDSKRRVRRAEDGYRRITNARSELVKANLRLVVPIAKRYISHGVAILDLIQEGNLGLMAAADRFDHRRGVRFASFAGWWIRQFMMRALSRCGRLIRLPEHAAAKLLKIGKQRRHLIHQLGRLPTNSEVADRLDMPPAVVEHLRRMAREPMSIDTPLDTTGSETTLGDLLPDRTVQPPDATVFQSQRKKLVGFALTSLPPRHREVLDLRFGLTQGHPMTLRAIGNRLTVSPERVRQIESCALERLRHPRRASQLQSLID